jgi:hypothetical protein
LAGMRCRGWAGAVDGAVFDVLHDAKLPTNAIAPCVGVASSVTFDATSPNVAPLLGEETCRRISPSERRGRAPVLD